MLVVIQGYNRKSRKSCDLGGSLSSVTPVGQFSNRFYEHLKKLYELN